MASFVLRSQRTGQFKTFSLLEILRLLGDTTNDEIWLEDGEDVYNLSSFRETGGSTSGDSGNIPAVCWNMETPAGTAYKDTFQLQYQLSVQNAVLLVILNGMVLTEGRDFTRKGKEIRLPFNLKTTDNLIFFYSYDRPVALL